MGKLSDYIGLEKMDQNECIELLSTDINKATTLTVSAVPVTYGVYLNDDLIYSCNSLKNAQVIYDAIRADMAGKAYEGKG